ncbi:hypothetical protein CHARACLAT_013992 [Characodon lateralis]|uniref:Uncharacterized protein n=1 Tax=Characodon lateralis TaxID=208331 RepID=A0ABU7EJ37_9TELE|nr:hypothetical protein [Characodon lateralis]
MGRGAGCSPTLIRVRGRVHQGQVASPSQEARVPGEKPRMQSPCNKTPGQDSYPGSSCCKAQMSSYSEWEDIWSLPAGEAIAKAAVPQFVLSCHICCLACKQIFD